MVCGVKQHTGKTSVSMTLLAGLREKFGNDKVRVSVDAVCGSTVVNTVVFVITAALGFHGLACWLGLWHYAGALNPLARVCDRLDS